LGTYYFVAGQSGYVVLSNDANQYVIADAIKFEFTDGSPAVGIMAKYWDYFLTQTVTDPENDHHKVTVYYGDGANTSTTVYLDGKCKTDFTDIRFTDQAGNFLNFWKHNVSVGTSCDCSILIDNTVTSISIYYGTGDPGNTFKVTCIGDIHHTPRASHYIRGALADDYTDDAVTYANNTFEADALLAFGDDWAHNGGNFVEVMTSLNVIEPKLANFNGVVARCVGNHDFYFADPWTDVRNGDGALNGLSSYYDYWEDDLLYGSLDTTLNGEAVRIIALDSNYKTEGTAEAHGTHYYSANRPGRLGEYVAGYVGTRQRNWLNNQLSSAPNKCIVINHHDIGGCSYGQLHHSTTKAVIPDDDEVRTILENNSDKIFCVLNGHTHWTQPFVRNGIIYLHIPGLACMGWDVNDSVAPWARPPRKMHEVYCRIRGQENDDAPDTDWKGQWVDLTFDTWKKEIKLEVVEDHAIDGALATHTSYLYYDTDDDFGKASNPQHTFAMGWDVDATGGNQREGGTYLGPNKGTNWDCVPAYGPIQNPVPTAIHSYLNDTNDINTFPNADGCITVEADSADTMSRGAFTGPLPEFSATGVADEFKNIFHFRRATNKHIVYYLSDDGLWDEDFFVTNPEAIGPAIRVSTTGALQYMEDDGVGWITTKIGTVTLTINTWYKIELWIDVSTKTYDIYVDDDKKNTSAIDFLCEGEGSPAVSELNVAAFWRDNNSDYYDVKYHIADWRCEYWPQSPVYGVFGAEEITAVLP
jgi:hypothetical protein